MKRILILILLVFYNLMAISNSTDSLINALNYANKNEKLNILIKITENYRSDNADTLLWYANHAIKLANELKLPDIKGLAYKNKGILLYINGNIPASTIAFNQAIKCFNQTKNHEQKANCYNNKSTLLLQLGDIKEATKMLNKALKIYTDINKPELTCTPLINLGRINIRTGNYKIAEQNLVKAIEIAKSTQNNNREIEAYQNLSALYSEQNEYLKALKSYDELIDKCNQINDLRTKSAVYANIGDIYWEIGNSDKAIEYIMESLELKKKLKLNNTIPNSYNQLGHIYLNNEMHETAFNLYSDALELAIKNNNEYETAYALSGLGNIYEHTEIFNKAIDYYTEALKIFELTGSKKEIAMKNIALGKIYALKLNDIETGNHYLEQAEQILIHFDSKNTLSELYFTKGEVYYLENDFVNASKFIENSINLLPSNAVSHYIKHKVLAQCYYEINEFEKSCNVYKKALMYKDSLVAQTNKLQKTQFKVEYHLQKKEQEISDLIRQNELNTLLLSKKRNMQYLFITIILLLCIIIGFGLYFFKKLKAINATLVDKQKEVEAQKKDLEDKNNQLEEANLEATKLSNYKSQFLANISHEVRTPLNAIVGYSKLLVGNLNNENNKHYINQVLQSTNNMTVIINDLLDFSKIEAGKMVLEHVDFNPVRIITNAISTLKFKAEEKNIQLEIHIDPYIPKKINGDPYRLSQILTNLISNAIKFSNEGQVVTIESKCENDEDNCNLWLAITDRGVGIPEKQLSTIFDSFNQEQSDTARLYEGTGLGLSIVKRLIELQKGHIEVKSELKKGTAFSFNISYKMVKSKKTNKNQKNREPANPTLSKTHNILLVEDNIINQELAKDTIASWNEALEVDIAENGKDAIIAVQKKDYSTILMDIQMPIMDGHEATQYIRNSLPEPKCTIPIIGMTAHAMSSEKEIALKNGMNDYITKPFNPDELKQKILYFIKQKEKN